MSQANVDIARRGYEAVASGDLDAVRELFDPDVKWHGGGESDPGACHNRDEVLQFIREAAARDAIGRLVDVVDAGDQVVVIMRPPSAGGEEPALRANVTTFRAGKVVEMVAYETPEDALAATRSG